VTRLRLGTRGSPLALAQSAGVAERLRALHPGLAVELVRIRTSGDRLLGRPLAAVGGKGLFVKEIEEALLRGEVDLAVHSAKDLPGELPPGLTLAAFPARADPRDAFLGRAGGRWVDLAEGAAVGTASLRRQAQLLHRRPDLKVLPLRGNVDTRLRQLDAGAFDGIILALAGLERLGLADRPREVLAPDIMLPAIGQGALGVEAREADSATRGLLAPLDDPPTRAAVTAERAVLRRLGGSCHTPVAAHAAADEFQVRLAGLIATPDGRRLVRAEWTGPAAAAERTGAELGEALLRAGGAEILAALEGRPAPPCPAGS
jgi:hydroxymethylbilane synthase